MVMGLESDIEDLETAGAARLNLIIRNEALEAGNSLKDRFGTPFVYGAPYGYQGTIDWLKQIFGCDWRANQRRIACSHRRKTG